MILWIFEDFGVPLGIPLRIIFDICLRLFSGLIFCRFLSVFGGPRRQRRGLPESSDSADSGHLFHHALLPLCKGAANLQAAASAAELQNSRNLI